MVLDGGFLILCVIGGIAVINTVRDILKTRRETYFDTYTKHIMYPDDAQYSVFFSMLSSAAHPSQGVVKTHFRDAESGAFLTHDIVCFDKGLWVRFDATTRNIWIMCETFEMYHMYMSQTDKLKVVKPIKVF